MDQRGNGDLGVAVQAHVDAAVLADLRLVDVGVDDLRVRGERVASPGHPVIESCAQTDQQVRLLQ